MLDCKQACILDSATEVLLFPDKGWWAKRLDVTIVAQGGPGRGSTITNEFLVVRQHVFYAVLIARLGWGPMKIWLKTGVSLFNFSVLSSPWSHQFIPQHHTA